jgi:hypothetical protein
MSDSTSISNLPTDPVGGGSVGGNVSFTANEKINVPTMSNGSDNKLDQATITQLVNGLQQASIAGVTQLASRDIQQTTDSIVQDPQVQLNYIPPASNKDYIRDHEENEDILHNYNKNLKQNDRLDELYNELQLPLLVTVLYFLFQLPIFKKYLYRFIPGLFSKDGNINLYGYFITCILFGIVFYIISKIIKLFSHF